MDSRDARRAAEKAARDLIANRAGVVGDLAQADSARQTAANTIADATAEAARLVSEATQRGSQLLNAANVKAGEADAGYADAHTAALKAGWTLSELATLGYSKPTARRKPPKASRPAAAAPADARHNRPSSDREATDAA